jgi:hypothetical protein
MYGKGIFVLTILGGAGYLFGQQPPAGARAVPLRYSFNPARGEDWWLRGTEA